MQIRLDIAPDPNTVRGYADDAVSSMQNLYRIHLDYSPGSLQAIDTVLKEWKQQGAPLDQITKSLYAFGSYAGEVALRSLPGTWVEPEPGEGSGPFEDFPFLAVHLEEGPIWKPVNLAFLIMTGEGDGFFQSFLNLLREP